MKENEREKSPFELWAFRFLVGAAFGIAFSIAAGETMLGACFLLFAVVLARKERKLAISPALCFALLFVTVAAVTAILGVDPGESERKMLKLLWFFAIPVSATLICSRERLISVLKGFVLGCMVAACRVIICNPVTAWKAWTRYGARPGNFLSELINLGSMTYGQVLAIGVIVTLGFIAVSGMERKPARGWWALLAVQALGLLLNFKRGAWFCALGLTLIFVCYRYDWKYLLPVVTLAVVLAALPPVRVRLESLRSEFAASKGGRQTMWFKIAPALHREYPWGVGYGAMSRRLMKKVAPEVEPRRDHLHSNIANIFAETGWLGLIAYLLWMAVVGAEAVRLIFRARRSGDSSGEVLAAVLLLMLVGLFAGGLVEYNFGDSEIKIMYAIVMGATAGLANRER